MSAGFDVHAEMESEDGGVPLTKVESCKMDLDAGSDTTSTSQDSGESASSSTNPWAEAVISSLGGSTEHEDDISEQQYSPASSIQTVGDSVTSTFGILQATLSMTSPPVSEAPHNLAAFFTTVDAGFDTANQVQYLHSNDGNSHEGWADQSNWPAGNHLVSNGIQPPDSTLPYIWSAASDYPQTSTNSLPTATENYVLPNHLEPPAGTSEDTSEDEDEIAHDASHGVLGDHPISTGMDHIDGSDEDWLTLSEDPHSIFNTDIAQMNGTLHTLSQASNMVSYYDHDDFEDNNNYFSVSFFLYYWKQMCMGQKPDFPRISQLANERAKIQRPDKITAKDCEECDLQGIHWSRYQTTKQEAREVRRMTYRNLRNLGQSEKSFATKEFKAQFPGVVIPSSDYYFRFNEMDMKRRPDFSHFQLRHNLSATSKNAVFYTNRPPNDAVSSWDAWTQYKTIVSFNPETGTEECAMDVTKRYNKDDPKITKIHTLTAGNGVLAAGSLDGVYALKSLSAGFESAPVIGTIATGGDVSTNHIHTHLDRQNGLPRAVFGSNDRTVRILDCVINSWVACHEYPYQVNCSITSPDGRLRLITGDACIPIVANAETGQTLAKLPGHTDYGFACDWAPDGITMATGHQDGLVKVWDARKLDESIETIAMEQAGCRSLQFSPLGSGKRVLVLAEPADFVHVVDAQTFESRQTIDFFGEISGISMPPDGSKLYIANADARFGGLIEFERSWNSSTLNRRPFRVLDWEEEHEEMVDCILDEAQPGHGIESFGDELYHRLDSPMPEENLPFGALPVGDSRIIAAKQQSFRCSNMGGGHKITACGERRTGAEERRYRRDYQDPRRKGFKIGRRSETLDWQSESDMEDDARVLFPKGQRGRQWMSRPEGEDVDSVLI